MMADTNEISLVGDTVLDLSMLHYPTAIADVVVDRSDDAAVDDASLARLCVLWNMNA